jgi:ribosomal protein S18 acetylase RimI-like enzyme
MTDAQVRVRPARPDDLGAWLRIFDAVVAEGRMGHEPPLDHTWAVGWFESSLVEDAQLRLVALLDEDVVGSLYAEDQRGRVSFGMFVAGSARGRGVGRALVEELLAWARGRDAHKVHLEVWPDNDPAIGLYESFGFTYEGRRVRQYRRRGGELWDSLIMGLVLDHTAPGGP